MTSIRERTRSMNSLVCFLQGMQGQRVMIDLRNEDSLCGKLDHVDSAMNTHLTDVTFTKLNGQQFAFEVFYIQGKHIRYVHIPDEVDVIETIEEQLDRYMGTRRGRRERITKPKTTFEKKERQKQMLQRKVDETKALIASLKPAKPNKEPS